MKNQKSLLRHEILNMLTAINIGIINNDLKGAKKERALDLVKLIALFISYEAIFLGKELKPSPRKFNLIEVLKIIQLNHQERIQKNRIKIQVPKEAVLIKADREFFSESLEQIIKKLLASNCELELKPNPKSNALTISCKKGEIPKLKPKKLSTCLNQKEPFEETGLQLSFELLKLNKIKWTSSAKEFVLKFPK